MLQAALPLLLHKLQPLVLLSPQTLHMLQVNTPHLSRLTLRVLQVALQILQHRQTGSDTLSVNTFTYSVKKQDEEQVESCEAAVHLDDAVQAVQVPLKRLTEHREVFTQLGGSSLAENRPPAFVQLQQVHRSVLLLLLQLVLIPQRGNVTGVQLEVKSCSLIKYYSYKIFLLFLFVWIF